MNPYVILDTILTRHRAALEKCHGCLGGKCEQEKEEIESRKYFQNFHKFQNFDRKTHSLKT